MLFFFITLFGVFLPEYGFVYPSTSGDSIYSSVPANSYWVTVPALSIPNTIIPIANMFATDDFAAYPVRMYYGTFNRTIELQEAFVEAFKCYIKLLDIAEWDEWRFPAEHMGYMQYFGRPESAAFMWNCMVYLVERDRLNGHDLLPAPDTSFQCLRQG